MWRAQGPFEIFLERYVAQSRARMRRRDRTGAVGAVISVMIPRRAMLRIVRLQPGLVTSPFAPDGGYVDVTGFPPGTAVEDPYTGKVFLTP